jgi:hypothetical protein
MDDQPLMRLVHCGADLPEQLEPLAYIESVLLTVDVDRLALDILEGHERYPVVRRAAVDQAGDMRVFE